ncbi:MAG: aromatic amino acid transaminase [Hyphomonadaceae bacterium]|nr:aromatic amino acid transaminase [Hyphomonadaceae bacterium]
MLADLQVRPPDPLLKLIKAFREDKRTDKIDLGVGVYRDESGNTPIMAAVKEAERRLLAAQTTKTYVGQQGDVDFLHLLGELVFGERAKELVSQQAVGGTGALRLGFDLLREAGARCVLMPTPSWPNHPSIIAAARLDRVDVPFFNVAKQEIELDALLARFETTSHGDAVLLQGVCHNPLGADFSREHWSALADAVVAHGVIPFIDVAYVGFGDGVEQDVGGIRAFLERVPEAVIAVSGAKTFGLYRERVGALYVQTPPAARQAAATNLAAIARSNYSMPPDHGAACVREVLSDTQLRTSWRAELDGIRSHIKKTRAALAGARVDAIPMRLIAAQQGMFSTLPLSDAQIASLRDEHGIYVTDAGRINVAGLREMDIERFVAALRAVT